MEFFITDSYATIMRFNVVAVSTSEFFYLLLIFGCNNVFISFFRLEMHARCSSVLCCQECSVLRNFRKFVLSLI